MECRFEGTAGRIELRGQGTTSLVRAVAFEQGLAERVELSTAKVGPLYPPVTIEAPESLDPVDLDPSAKAYRAVYELVAKGQAASGQGVGVQRNSAQGPGGPGASVHIDIQAGAAREGRFLGKLDGAPGCGEGDGCKVTWPDAGRIVLTLHPAAERVAAAAQKGTPIRLTGWFPFVDHAEGEASPDRLDRVELDRVSGSLICDGTRTEVTGKLVWSPAEHESVRIGWPADPRREAAGIAVAPDGLRLTVVSSFPPERAAAGTSLATGSAATAPSSTSERAGAGTSQPGGAATAPVSSSAPERDSAGTSQVGGAAATTALVVAALVIVAALVALVVWFHRRKPGAPGPSSQPAGVSSAGSSSVSARASELAQSPERETEPVAIVLLAATPDAAFSAALARHLHPYRKRLFDPHDRACLPAGKDQLAETGKAILEARVVAVLVTADFFSGTGPWSSLLAIALEQRAARGLSVVPVLARPFAWEATELASLAPLPAQGEIGSADNDAALKEVAERLVALA